MGSIVIIYCTASGTHFDVAVHGPVRRLDYLRVEHEGEEVLCQVEDVVRKGGLSYEEAVQGQGAGEDHLSASVEVVGYIDDQGLVQTPRTPFRAGQEVHAADPGLVMRVLGLEPRDGAYIGRVTGTDVPVRLSMNMLAQKHVSVLAKTGAGKSYTVGVLLEEFLAADVPMVILDPHGEYASLRHANIDEADIEVMARQGLRPRSFDDQVIEYALDHGLNPDAQRLRLEGINLDGHELVDLMGGKLSGGQVGLLYQALKEVKEHLPSYTLQDIMDAVQQNKSSAKWNVINALEALDGTGVFHIRGTAIKELVQPKQCTIINLKGVSPDVQEVAVTRLVGLLWQARKRGEVPPFILVCEEAHNFCPERGVGNAISGPVIRTVASEGRKFGMGLVIVSQRPAKIDKNVLSQCNTQFVLKVTNPNDLKAIISSVEGITGKAGDEIQRLAVGTALVVGGGLTQPVFAQVRPRLTRHGGASIDIVQSGGKAKARKAASKRASSQAGAASSDPPAPPAATERIRSPPSPSVDRAASPSAPSRGREAAATGPGHRVASPQPSSEHPGPATGGPAGASSQPGSAEPDKRRESASKLDLPTRSGPSTTPTGRAEPSATSRGAPTAAAGKAPDQPAVERPAATPPAWSEDDADAIQRVARRVGIVEGRGPAETIAFIENLARQNGRDPRMRVGLYAEIGRKVCHDEMPACIRCPLGEQCQFHQRLRTERRKNRGGIRRLWSR